MPAKKTSLTDMTNKNLVEDQRSKKIVSADVDQKIPNKCQPKTNTNHEFCQGYILANSS